MIIPQWVEAVVPLGIITVLVSAMGALPAAVQHVAYGKPKPVLIDGFDRQTFVRDALLKQQAEQK